MITLYPFQEEGVRRIKAANLRTLLADDMGLGKTAQVLKCLYDLPEVRPALIVCPANVKPVWQHQAAQHLGMRVEVLSSRTPPAEGLYKPKVAVINYDLLVHWEKYLLKLKPSVIVFDECHYLQSPTAKRTRAAIRIAKNVPHLLFLSGTPCTNKVTEMWPVLHMLNKRRFPNYLRFAFKYTWPRKTPWAWDFSKPKKKRVLWLHHKLVEHGMMIRRTKEEVLKDLPPKRKLVVPVELKDRKEYDAAEKDFRSWLKKHQTAGQFVRSMRSEAGQRVQHLKRLAAKLKLPNVIAWVKDFMAGTDEKLVLFCIHKAVVRALKEAFADCAVVTGDVTGKKRELETERFNKIAKCRLFVGNIHAAGTGWSASDCSTTASCELAWKPGDHDQADDRVRGIGRGRKGVSTTNYYLLAPNTIETRIINILETKRKTCDLMLDGKIGDDGFDVIQEVMNSYLSD